MTISIEIVVMDAAPLIFLAAGRSLHEATAASDKLGGQEIIAWYRDNSETVRVEPTAIFQRETKAGEVLGGRLPRDIGERAALELSAKDTVTSIHANMCLQRNEGDSESKLKRSQARPASTRRS